MKLRSRVVVPLLAVSLLPSCMVGDEWTPPDPSADGELGVAGLEGHEMQGKFLLGPEMDYFPSGNPLLHFNVGTKGVDAKGNTVDVEFDGDASLRAPDGVILSALTGDKLAVTLSRRERTISYYRLSRWDGSRWGDPCGGLEAIPLAGTFSRLGLHTTDNAAYPTRITFACLDGVAAKCPTWGYVPGTEGIEGAQSDAWRAHQACTRMARFDYCADGTSHTREETFIQIYDNLGFRDPPPPVFEGVPYWPPPPGQFYFEAAWQAEDKPPICLSRLRWQSLRPGGHCGVGVLDDPRESSSAKYCENLEEDEDADPILFDASRYVDMALHTWSSGSDLVGTVQGYYQPAVGTGQPFPGTWVHQQLDGLILRSLPGSVELSEVSDVGIWQNAAIGDRVLGRAQQGANWPPAGYTFAGWEGMVFNAWREGTVALRLYKNPAGTDMLSTTRPPPVGYTAVSPAPIGWVIVPED